MRCILQAYPHHSISPHSACILQPYPQKFHLYPFARGVARMHTRRNTPLPFCQGVARTQTRRSTQAHAEEHANSPKSPELPFIISTLLSTLPYCKGSIKHQTHHNASILRAYPLYHPLYSPPLPYCKGSIKHQNIANIKMGEEEDARRHTGARKIPKSLSTHPI